MSTKQSAGSRLYRGIRIRRRGDSWQVDYGKHNGKRVQRSFKTKELARGDINEHAVQALGRQKDIEENGICLQHLARSQRIDVLEALEMLGAASLSGMPCHSILSITLRLVCRPLFEKSSKSTSRQSARQIAVSGIFEPSTTASGSSRRSSAIQECPKSPLARLGNGSTGTRATAGRR